MLVPIFAFTHQLANQFNHHFVVDMIVVSADDVSLAQFAFFQDEVNGSVVVIDVNPVANLLAGAVQFGLDIAQNIGDLARNELFDVLVWTVIIRTIGDRRFDAEAANPGAYQHVAGSFSAGVGAGRVVRRIFSEAVRVVKLQITKHFVCRDVMEALAVLADSLKNGVGADDVGFDKRPRIAQGIVVVTFSGKMHNDVVFSD